MNEVKPQCETAAACLRELARVMEQFGLTYPHEAYSHGYIKCCNRIYMNSDRTDFFVPSDWQFAIAEVEGKPVFSGDELYFFAQDYHKGMIDWTKCSWNPPKPKTVLVELPYDIAEYAARLRADISPALTQACKKALEELK